MEEIEKLQYDAALIVTGAWKGSNRSKLYDELGWESLSDRRRIRRTLLLHKIVNNCTPSYLKDKLPPQHYQVNLDTPPLFTRPGRFNSTNRYNNSFFPDAIKNWILRNYAISSCSQSTPE